MNDDAELAADRGSAEALRTLASQANMSTKEVADLADACGAFGPQDADHDWCRAAECVLGHARAGSAGRHASDRVVHRFLRPMCFGRSQRAGTPLSSTIGELACGLGGCLGPDMLTQGFDETLVRARSGDEHAFERIYGDLQPALLRYSQAHFPRLAEDISAEVWLQVTRAVDRFVGDEQEFRAWIFAIARNKIIDQARQQAHRPTILLADTEEINGNGHDTRDVAEDYEDDEATRRAPALVRTLPPA